MFEYNNNNREVHEEYIKLHKVQYQVLGIILVCMMSYLAFSGILRIRSGRYNYHKNGCDTENKICGNGFIVNCSDNMPCINIINCTNGKEIYIEDNICHTNVGKYYEISSEGFYEILVGAIYFVICGILYGTYCYVCKKYLVITKSSKDITQMILLMIMPLPVTIPSLFLLLG